MKVYNINEILPGVIIISLTVNSIGGVIDISYSSILFITIVFAIIVGISSTLLPIKSYLSFTATDFVIAIITIGYFFSHQPFDNLWNMASIALFFIYWMLRLTGKLNYFFLYTSILISDIILIITGYLQYIGYITSDSSFCKITGPYQNSSIYAGVLCLLMSAIIAWCLYPGYRLRYQKLYITSVILFILSIPPLLITTCRSAWLALLLVSIIMYCTHSPQIIKRTMKWSLFHIKLGTIGLVLLTTIFIYGLYILKKDSVDGRLLIWKVTLQMIKDKPITGFGSDGFISNYMFYQASYLKSNGSDREKFLAGNNHIVYNEPLRFTVEYGLLGLLLYIGIVHMVLKKQKTNISILLARSVLMSGVIWGFFSYPGNAFPVLVIIMLAFLVTIMNKKRKYIKHKSSINVLKSIRLLNLSISCIFLISGIYIYHNHHIFFNSLKLIHENKIENFISECSKLERIMKNETFFWMIYCKALEREKYDCLLLEKITNWERLYPCSDVYIMKGDLLQRMQKNDQAEDAYWLAHYMVPSRQKARSRLALLYKKEGLMDDALVLVHDILSEKVKIYGFETYEIHQDLKRIFENQLK